MRQAKGSPGEPRCPLSSQSWTPGRWHFISHARLHAWFSFRNLGTPVVSALGERTPGSVELADAGIGGGEEQGVLQMGTLLCPSLGFSCPQVIFSYISLSYLVLSLISPFSSFSEKKEKKGEESQTASLGKVYSFYF